MAAVIGPLWQTAHPSGITHPTCTHQAPDSCNRCDGTSAEDREFWSSTPAQRRTYLRGLWEWRRDFHSQPQPEGNIA